MVKYSLYRIAKQCGRGPHKMFAFKEGVLSDFLGEIAMKKTLIALAVLAASGAAMAQSSVTLYGVVDLGIGKYDKDLGGSGKANMISSETLNNGNSRIGLRGVEDLGGGLKAGFNFEQGINAENGGSANSVNGGLGWGRAANVWLGGNWGTFKMGRTLTPSYYGLTAYELTGAANYSVVANTYGFVGAGARNNSQFSYTTPNMGGFSAEVGYIFKADNNDAAKWDLNAMYVNGPIGAGISANKEKGGKTNYALGGKYNFGNFALAASYQAARNEGYTVGNSVFSGKRQGVTLGGTVAFGAASITLDLTRDLKRELDSGTKLKKYTNGLLEAKYALSKRTFVYGDYLRLDGTNNVGFGLRHNF
jgi:predicted porin